MTDLDKSYSLKGNSPPLIKNQNFSNFLANASPKIIHTWEARVRDKIGSAQKQTISVLQAHLPEILKNLVLNTSPQANAISFAEAGELGKSHGEQRANLSGYTVTQIIEEYRILRKVIFEILEEEDIPTAQLREVILDVLDEGLKKALEQFSLVRTEYLKRSNRDLEHFAAIAAHDLKSPLATIMGFTELLQDSLSDRLQFQEKNFLQAISRSSARMTLLIDRLLEYSSVGKDMKPFGMVDINKVVKGVLENLTTTISHKGANIQVDDLPTVFGESSLLTQLFQNIISNSLKYSHPDRNPEISVRCRREKANWLFSIEDNGIGFDPKEKDNIFSLYKRLESTKLEPGLGIGLATARKVMELHGGDLWAESQPGLGSKFCFTIPVLNEAVAKAGAQTGYS